VTTEELDRAHRYREPWWSTEEADVMGTESKPASSAVAVFCAVLGVLAIVAVILLVRYTGDTTCAHTAFNCPGRH
jgi:hypothetical protein